MHDSAIRKQASRFPRRITCRSGSPAITTAQNVSPFQPHMLPFTSMNFT